MRVVFCWTDISGHSAACWRALRSLGVDVSVIAYHPGLMAHEIGFDPMRVMAGIDHELLDADRKRDAAHVERWVADRRPDAVVIVGWAQPPYVALARSPRLAHARFVLGMDNARKDTWRQRLARLKIGPLLDRMDAVAVAGERSFQLARYLGVPERKILRGVYGYDGAAFEGVSARRATAGAWPHAFLFTGRYVEDKGLDVLLDAYAAYRSNVSNPWGLTLCGRGTMTARVAAASADPAKTGVTDRGFVQPADVPGVFAAHGALVLPSRFEPWGVTIAEAAAAGLPVVCSESCGASVEVVRHLYNGLLVPTADAGALSRALRWLHDHEAELPEMGRRGAALAKPFAAENWARRWKDMLERVADTRRV